MRVSPKKELREIEDAWGKESTKRLAEYEAEQAETISADEVDKQIQSS